MLRGFSMGNYSSYASRDLEDYRAHYPSNKDEIRLNKNLQFFRNEYPLQPEGVLIEDVIAKWKGNYRHLESSHSFIQWLFPIQEKGMNWESQILQKHEIASMRADPEVLARVVKVFRVMLDFYGMELVNEQKAIFRRLDDNKPQYRNLNSSSHNYLRITRMLKNLGEMGFEHLKIGWLEFFFQEICITRLLPNCESSFFNYWSGTIYDDDVRAKFNQSCLRRIEEAKEARKRQRDVDGPDNNDARSSAATSKSPSQSQPTSQPTSQPASQSNKAPSVPSPQKQGVADSLEDDSSSNYFSSDDDEKAKPDTTASTKVAEAAEDEANEDTANIAKPDTEAPKAADTTVDTESDEPKDNTTNIS